jgi:hypothetical protein
MEHTHATSHRLSPRLLAKDCEAAYTNAVMALALYGSVDGCPWWAVPVGGKRWLRITNIRKKGLHIQAYFRNTNMWRYVEGFSCIRGDED